MGQANTQEHDIMNRHAHKWTIEYYYRCYVFKIWT